MSAEDQLGGYASGFTNLDASEIAAHVTDDFKLLDKDGSVYSKAELPGYIAELRNSGDRMEISEVLAKDGKAWCKWQVGEIVGAGLISFGEDGISQEQLF